MNRCKDKQNWFVTMRNCNQSAFSGYKVTPSDYSEVICALHMHRWRTKARYVDTLPNSTFVVVAK